MAAFRTRLHGVGTAALPVRYAMMIRTETESGHALVADVREAARHHNSSWEAMVPNHFTINLAAEQAEEIAYQEMAEAKRSLSAHICHVYGISARELASLAMP